MKRLANMVNCPFCKEKMFHSDIALEKKKFTFTNLCNEMITKYRTHTKNVPFEMENASRFYAIINVQGSE